MLLRSQRVRPHWFAVRGPLASPRDHEGIAWKKLATNELDLGWATVPLESGFISPSRRQHPSAHRCECDWRGDPDATRALDQVDSPLDPHRGYSLAALSRRVCGELMHLVGPRPPAVWGLAQPP